MCNDKTRQLEFLDLSCAVDSGYPNLAPPIPTNNKYFKIVFKSDLARKQKTKKKNKPYSPSGSMLVARDLKTTPEYDTC